MPFRKRLFSSPIHGPWKRSDVCRNLRAGKVAFFLFFSIILFLFPYLSSVFVHCNLYEAALTFYFYTSVVHSSKGNWSTFMETPFFLTVKQNKKREKKKETRGKEGRSRFWSLLRINTRCHRIRLYVHRFERSRQQQIRLTSRFYLSQGNVKSIQISEVESYARYTTPKGAELMLRSSQTIGKSFYRSLNRLYWINSATIWLTSST